MTVAVETFPHEFQANYIFDTHALKPYFAIDSVVKDSGGSRTMPFSFNGNRWKATLYYQDSGIQHPGNFTPQGTEFRIQEIREFRIHITRDGEEDPVGEQKANFHISPRWQGMKVENSEGDVSELSVPDGLSEGINVRANGSNIEYQHYKGLLRRSADVLDLNTRYFETPNHDLSNTQDAGRYVRIHTDRSGPIHGRDGPLAKMGHLLENDRSGYRKVVQNDDDEHGRNLPGYYHTVTLGPTRVREAFPDHALPKEIKHYYAREAASKPEDDPLAHPKLEASYQVSRWDRSLGVEEDDLAQLTEELEEAVLSVLAEAGLSVRPFERDDDARLFISDAYFEPVESDRDREVYDLGLTELEHQQESIVINHIADGLSPVEWESLEMLVTDGGEVAPRDIADEYDRHEGSVRRALNRLPDLIEHDYGEVSLRSEYIAERVHDAVQEAKDATRRAVEATAKAKETAERGADASTSALMAWAASVGVEIDDRRDAALRIRMEGVSNFRRTLRTAYELWTEAGHDPMRFRQAEIKREDGYADAWRYL